MTAYNQQSHVNIGDLATASAHNTLLDNMHALWTNAAAGAIPYWSAINTMGALARPTNPGFLYNLAAGMPSFLQPAALEIPRINSSRTGVEGSQIGWRGTYFRAINQTSFPAGDTAISFTNAFGDYTSWWSAGSPTRVTIGANGNYLFSGGVQADGKSALGYYTARIKKNGTTLLCQDLSLTESNNTPICSLPAKTASLAIGEYLELFFENSNGTIIGDSNAATTFLTLVRVQ